MMHHFEERIEELEKENAALKAKCNLCYESMADKSNKAITELKAKLAANRFIFNTNERHKYQDKIIELQEQIANEIIGDK